ncbi:MAG: GGDEF domain-containing protein [Noviherbaspirillum sp.]
MRFRRLRLSTETGQAWCRLLVALAALGAIVLARLWPAQPGLDAATILIACYVAYAGLWLAALRRSLLPGRTRRIAAVIIDQLAFAAALYLGGAYCAPVMCVPLSVAIGNGLRYGRQYTRLAVAVGAPACALAVAASPYWRSMPAVAAGVVLSIIVIPLYASALNARMAQAKLRLARRAARFELASMTDSVTGVLNRHGFMNALNERGAAAGQSAGALMLLDLDGFKAVNDACGHAAGDMVLVDTAHRLARCFRASDRVARIGGDEFAVLLVDVRDQLQVEQLAVLALAAIADIRIELQPQLRLSASIGVCMLPHPQADGIQAMLHMADSLMYEAKKSGKNRYRILAAMPASLVLAA